MNPSNFEAKHVREVVVLRFPFGQELPLGITIASLQLICTVSSVASGQDPTPANLLLGPASITAGEVFQRVQQGVAGVTYLMVCVATLSSGLVLVRAGLLPVIDFA
jgi:hypothetical protein